MIITIIALGILLLTCLFVIYNLLRKLESLEEDGDYMMDWIFKLNTQVTHILKRTDEIDRQGLFKADDETGSIFKDLKTIIYTIKNLVVKVDE